MKLKAALGPLRSGKKVLEGKASELQDLMAAASSPENEEKTAWKEAATALLTLKLCIDDLRFMIPKFEKIPATDVLASDVFSAEKAKGVASSHLDCIKEKLKKLKAVL